MHQSTNTTVSVKINQIATRIILIVPYSGWNNGEYRYSAVMTAAITIAFRLGN